MSNEWKTLTEILPEIGRAAEADPKNWHKNFEEKWCSGNVTNVYPSTALSTLRLYRRKPREMEYTVRRPEPLLERPEVGQRYWVAAASAPDWAYLCLWPWCGDPIDELRFNRGLCYATEEDAVAAAKAMVGEVE